ncbi:MAG: agmatinase [Phycisphaerales bacterium]
MPTQLPDARVSPRFAGISTFCRYPQLRDVVPEQRPLDWVVYGIPFDGGVTYRPGTKFGPRAVRDASQYVKRYHMVHGVDVCEVLSMADGGDAPVSPFDIKATLDLATEFALTLGGPTTRLLAVGGDHSVAYANIRAAWTRAGSPAGGLALVHFDSHLDTVDVLWGERYSHASPFIRAIEDGFVDPKAMISVGVKGPLNSRADLDFAKSRGVTLLPHHRVATEAPTVLPAFVRGLNGRPAYVTFDIDVVDPAFAPGTGTPCPGGLTSAEALDLLRLLKGVNLVGGDVVEVLPDRDVSGITAFLAAHVVFEILALDAAARAG